MSDKSVCPQEGCGAEEVRRDNSKGVIVYACGTRRLVYDFITNESEDCLRRQLAAAKKTHEDDVKEFNEGYDHARAGGSIEDDPATSLDQWAVGFQAGVYDGLVAKLAAKDRELREVTAERDELLLQRGDACPDTARAVAHRCASEIGASGTAEDRIHTAVYGYGLAVSESAHRRADEAEGDARFVREVTTSLLNKVNAVTAPHRHGQRVSPDRLDALANRQIDVERMLSSPQHDSGATVDPTVTARGSNAHLDPADGGSRGAVAPPRTPQVIKVNPALHMQIEAGDSSWLPRWLTYGDRIVVYPAGTCPHPDPQDDPGATAPAGESEKT